MSSSGPRWCPYRLTPASEKPVNAFLILDRSGSMSQSGKWTAAKLAVTALLTDHSTNVAFGLAMFPRVGVNDPQNCQPGNVRVPLPGTPGASTTAIMGELDNVSPQGNTPTWETLNVFVQNTSLLGLGAADRQNILLLITDGQPNCLDNDTTGAGTISMLTQLHQQLGIAVYVVGFGSGVDPDILNNMAVAGGAPLPGAQSYYRADDQAQLDTVLGTIATTLEGCSFLVPGNLADASQVRVTVRGHPVAHDPHHDANGWDHDPATHVLTFYGTACTDPTTGARGATPFQVVVDAPCVP
jgi:hypothetical protein